MNHEDRITKVTQQLLRKDGSQAKIVVEAMFGAGLHRSLDVTVFRRDNENQPWRLCSSTPAPGWKDMSVDSYIKSGRSEMLQVVTTGEILRAAAMIGQPMPSQTPEFA